MKRNAFAIILVLLALSGIMGCAASNAYRRGLKYMKNQEFEQASESFGRAIALSPNNLKFRLNYATAQYRKTIALQRDVEVYEKKNDTVSMDKARETLKTIDAELRRGKDAIDIFRNQPKKWNRVQELAAAVDIGIERAHTKIAEVENRRTEYVRESRDYYDQGRQKVSERSYDAAQECFQHSLDFDPTFEDSRTELRFAQNMAGGVSSMAKKEYRQAHEQFSIAAKTHPDNKDMQQWLKKSRWEISRTLYEQALEQYQGKKFDSAIGSLDECLSFTADYPNAKEKREEIIIAYAQHHYDIGVARRQENKYFASLEQLRKAASIKPNFKDVAAIIDEVREEGAQNYYARAREFEKQELLGVSIHACQLGVELKPIDALVALEKDLATKVKKQAQIRVAWVGIGALSYHLASVAGQLEHRILQQVLNSSILRQGLLEILDREHLQKIFAEQTLSISDYVDEQTIPTLGKIRVADVLFSGKLLSYEESEHQVSSESGTKQYLERYDTVIHTLQTVYGPLPIPEKIPVYSTLTYERIGWESYVTLDFAGRLTDITTGQVLEEITGFSRKKEDSCTEVKILSGNCDKAQVYPVPKRLNSPEVMKNSLLEESANEISTSLIKDLSPIEVYKQRAGWYEKQGEKLKALDMVKRLEKIDPANENSYFDKALALYPRD